MLKTQLLSQKTNKHHIIHKSFAAVGTKQLINRSAEHH